jgi:hypothetical protein
MRLDSFIGRTFRRPSFEDHHSRIIHYFEKIIKESHI